MSKKLITRTILSIESNKPIPFSVVKENNIELQDNDIINAGYQEPYNHVYIVYDGGYHFEVIREREETDEEYQKRISREEKENKDMQERRYKSFLKLKKEFEPDDLDK